MHGSRYVRKRQNTSFFMAESHTLVIAGLNPNPTVEVLYAGKAPLAEGPFFEPENNQLLWVDIFGKSINFLNLETRENK